MHISSTMSFTAPAGPPEILLWSAAGPTCDDHVQAMLKGPLDLLPGPRLGGELAAAPGV
jgi:hypothetical protein